MLRSLRGSWLSQPFSGRKRVQTVGFSSPNIESIKSLGYKPKEGIKFQNGKFLIYRSIPSWGQWLKDYFLYMAACIGFGWLIWSRYNMDLYPAVFHLYVGGIALSALFFMRKFLRLQSVVKEIYLLEGGRATQIVFRNAFKRKLFGEPLSATYYNSLFVPPPIDETALRYLHQFPSDTSALLSSPRTSAYWKKYFSNDGNFMLIPQHYDFMQAEIMGEVMNGKVIL